MGSKIETWIKPDKILKELGGVIFLASHGKLWENETGGTELEKAKYCPNFQ